MSEDAPKIEFPFAYPVKVMGFATPDYKQFVMDVMEIHAPGFDRTSVTLRESSTGKYYSVTITIEATGEPQLKALFEDLKTQ